VQAWASVRVPAWAPVRVWALASVQARATAWAPVRALALVVAIVLVLVELELEGVVVVALVLVELRPLARFGQAVPNRPAWRLPATIARSSTPQDGARGGGHGGPRYASACGAAQREADMARSD